MSKCLKMELQEQDKAKEEGEKWVGGEVRRRRVGGGGGKDKRRGGKGGRGGGKGGREGRKGGRKW